MTNPSATQEPGLDAAGLKAAWDAMPWAFRHAHPLTGRKALSAAIRAYEAHRSGAGEPVAWDVCLEDGTVASSWRNEDHARASADYFNRSGQRRIVKPLVYASPAKAGELEELRRTWTQELIDCAPLSLRLLGEMLSNKLDDDQWNNAEPFLVSLAAALSDSPASAARPAVTSEMVERLSKFAEQAANGIDIVGEVLQVWSYPKGHPQWQRVVVRQMASDVRAALEAALSHAPASMNGTQGECDER